MIANIQKFTSIFSLIIKTPCREKKVGSEKQEKKSFEVIIQKAQNLCNCLLLK